MYRTFFFLSCAFAPFFGFLPVWYRAGPVHRDSIAFLGEKVQDNNPKLSRAPVSGPG